MKTLEQGGLPSRSLATERYRLGVDLIGLAEASQEVVNLSVLDAQQVVNLEQFVPQTRQVRNVGRVVRRMCTHCTAAGKVF